MAQQLRERTVGPNDGCGEFDAGLAAYLEQEGNPVLAAHAEGCAFCGALLRDLQLLVAEAGRLELQDPPARVWLNIRAALAEEGLLETAGVSNSCRAFYAALSAYLEGEKTPAVARHAEECAFCGVVLRDFELMITEAGRLELEDPRPRVWANIRATLAAEGVIHKQPSPWTGWLRHFEFLHPAPVAAMAGVIFLGVLLLAGPRVNTRTQADRNLHPTEEAALLQTQEQVRLLERSYREQEAAIAPEVKADFRKSLASLDSSIQEAEHSIEQGPDSSLAREYLQGAYIRKAEVLSSALEYAGR
ncbi:MAG: hypothetical protein ACLQOO_11720 [Terriglobia bacterium]